MRSLLYALTTSRVAALAALIVVALVSQGMVWLGCEPPRERDRRPLSWEKVADRLFVIRGGGGNTAAFISDAGVVLVDTKLPGRGRQLLDVLREITDKPVATIINTHYHNDHTGNNGALAARVEIVANDRAASWLARLRVDEVARPTRTFRDRMTLSSGADTIDLYYFGRAHTDGDTVVVFPDLRTAHVGDLFAGRNVPIVDWAHGGSALEYPDTLDRIVDGIAGVDTVITGHDAVTDWEGLRRYARFNRDVLAWARRSFADGVSAESASGGSSLADQYADYRLKSWQLQSHLNRVYEELARPPAPPRRLWRGVVTGY